MIRLAMGIALVAMATDGGAAKSESKGALDGKTFAVTVTEKGKTTGDANELSFKDGKFRSKTCDPYGFGDGAYKTKVARGVSTFEVSTESPTEGKNLWTGTVKGDTLEGKQVWSKPGQAPIEYAVKGTLKK